MQRHGEAQPRVCPRCQSTKDALRKNGLCETCDDRMTEARMRALGIEEDDADGPSSPPRSPGPPSSPPAVRYVDNIATSLIKSVTVTVGDPECPLIEEKHITETCEQCGKRFIRKTTPDAEKIADSVEGLFGRHRRVCEDCFRFEVPQ